jgi:hypothetical protein
LKSLDYGDEGRDGRGCFPFRPGDPPRSEGPAAIAAKAGLLSLLVAAKLISEDGAAMALFAQESRWAKKKTHPWLWSISIICLYRQVRLGERLLQNFSFFSLIKLAAIDFNAKSKN